MEYGAKIWGWKEKKEIEKIHERFLKWMLGINICKYIIYNI